MADKASSNAHLGRLAFCWKLLASKIVIPELFDRSEPEGGGGRKPRQHEEAG